MVEVSPEVEERLLNSDYVIVHIKEHYYPDGVGVDYTILYPLGVEELIDSDNEDLVMDYIRESYQLFLTLNISQDEVIEFYRRNKA